MKGHVRVVGLLIERGADCNQTGKGLLPLHVVCQNGSLDIVKKLLSAGSAIDSAEWENGFTPLHYACLNNHVEVVNE